MCHIQEPRWLERLLDAGREGLCAINSQAANHHVVGVPSTTKVLKSFEHPASDPCLESRDPLMRDSQRDEKTATDLIHP